MSGDVYFLMTRDHKILGSFNDISDARDRLHKTDVGQYIVRLDGVVLAFMSREGQSWRAPSKVSVDIRTALCVYANINPDQEPEVAEEIEEVPEPPVRVRSILYPPAEPDLTEASFGL
jgi:hypothetical protein